MLTNENLLLYRSCRCQMKSPAKWKKFDLKNMLFCLSPDILIYDFDIQVFKLWEIKHTCQRFTSFVPHWPLKQCARKNLHKNTFSPNGTSDSFDVKDTRKFHYSELNAFVTVQSRGARNVNLTQCTVVHPLLVTETSWLSGNSSKNRNIYYFEVFEPRDKNLRKS